MPSTGSALEIAALSLVLQNLSTAAYALKNLAVILICTAFLLRSKNGSLRYPANTTGA